MNKKVITTAFFSLLTLFGCNNKTIEEEEKITPVGTPIKVKLEGSFGQESSKTKAGYANTGRLSIYAPGSENMMFDDAGMNGDNLILQGTVKTWEGEESLYVIYPYNSEGYTINDGMVNINLESDKHILDRFEAEDLLYNIFIAEAENATAIDEDNYNIPDVKFKSLLANLTFNITENSNKNIVVGATIKSADGAKVFVVSADFDPKTGEVIAGTEKMSDSFSIDFIEKTYNSLSVTMPLIATYLPVEGLVLSLKCLNKADYSHYYLEHPIIAGAEIKGGYVYSYSDEALNMLRDFYQTYYIDDLRDSKTVITTSNLVLLDESVTMEDINVIDGKVYGNISISLPNASQISSSTFNNMRYLEYLHLPKATRIGPLACDYCTALRYVWAPMVETIEGFAFRDCRFLSEFYAPKLKTIGKMTFSSCGISAIDIPEVTEIGVGAFGSCANLKSLSLPKVEVVSDYAFGGCSSLTEINIPLVKSVGKGAFGNTGFTELSLPNVARIEMETFEKCENLQKVVLADVTYIDFKAFKECFALSQLELATNSKLTYIHERAFESYEKITEQTVLTIGKANAEFISGNTLTVGQTSLTFKEIKVI